MTEHITLALDQFDVKERAECGCELSRNTKGRVIHRYCPLHHAAPILLAALEGLLAAMQAMSPDTGVSVAVAERFFEANAAITKAEEPTQP